MSYLKNLFCGWLSHYSPYKRGSTSEELDIKKMQDIYAEVFPGSPVKGCTSAESLKIRKTAFTPVCGTRSRKVLCEGLRTIFGILLPIESCNENMTNQGNEN
ncbi:hypothetical protein HHI36_001325 [Cryptolaemus montrouzieri]|uniref:Uncharacterized protein n=1 Tax=Cryptolaemus montrouzieri TaxID=559131 RepID=A0ABD2P728_9CUCU